MIPALSLGNEMMVLKNIASVAEENLKKYDTTLEVRIHSFTYN